MVSTYFYLTVLISIQLRNFNVPILKSLSIESCIFTPLLPRYLNWTPNGWQQSLTSVVLAEYFPLEQVPLTMMNVLMTFKGQQVNLHLSVCPVECAIS